jgi:histone acetyltransferase (RNA polymerase elongator complex component)
MMLLRLVAVIRRFMVPVPVGIQRLVDEICRRSRHQSTAESTVSAQELTILDCEAQQQGFTTLYHVLPHFVNFVNFGSKTVGLV